MLSRSKSKTEWAEAFEDRRAWTISTASHVAIAAALAWIIFWGRPKTESLPLDIVVEAPKASVAVKAPELKKAPTKEEPKIKPKAVYGMSRKAVTSDEAGLDVKQGNTVAKTPDNEKLKPEDPDALPIPADEILVSRMPKLKAEVRIPYPEEAKRSKVQGAVVMDLLIDASGRVREAKFVAGPGAGLDEAALSAVRGFEFEPALIQDKPVAVRIRYAYRFVLE